MLRAAGSRIVFEDGERFVSGDEMLSMIWRVAGGLRSDGVVAGDGVVLRLGVNPEALAAIMGAFVVGARVSGVRDQVLPDDAGSMLIDDERVNMWMKGPDNPQEPAGRPRDIARVLWTSGSTGAPKGCCQTYASMSAAWAAHPDRWPPAVRSLATRLQRYLVFGSLSSQVMLEYGVLTLAAGGTMVAARPPGFPDAIVRHRATAGVITVGKLNQLVRDQRAKPVDLGSLRALLVSGSPLPPGRLREALDVLGPVVFHGYGQTETGMIAMLTPDEMTPSALDSVGRPPVHIDVRDGEIYVRTPAQASSYWNDPEETAAVFVNGWVRTRDLGALGNDGLLRLTGRARDVIIVHAELVYAGAVERVLVIDPTVAEAYVIGRPDDTTGESVHAYVVPTPGSTPDVPALTHLVAKTLGDPAAPSSVTVIDHVPLAPSGKPDKQALAGE
ncbi:class I adenylate-forming enzyme family protein [Paractinoplanes brasiliensis]|uniref:Acyl-CoA synthetase (AMP-forming)/AMP-acid ligase II n=1 Tax=Paractinoplanes brasiliensis TaxID=52695 RepID=A0A4R6JB01_9ACTN|nr:AMP-binding protein [Actinoplanes brasiliensis]TDO31665.1 acyl-CoA synthetase (AMP-forming)/AMP-acid ligase II [Actinoplanes brasiliensis]GID30742.1 AMP-dependent synthetase [Actinoplanes brasiliensis]